MPTTPTIPVYAHDCEEHRIELGLAHVQLVSLLVNNLVGVPYGYRVIIQKYPEKYLD
jgi:hypothetical protein